MKTKYFKKAKSFYRNNFYLLKNSGPLKSALRNTCEALDITYYTLPKCHGTRFVNHRKRGFTKLLHLWPAFITAYQNALLTTSNSKTKAKITGLLKKFLDVRELLRVEAFLDVLELVSVTSLVFEKKDLLPCDISTSMNITISKIDRFIQNGKEKSNLNLFSIKPTEKGKCTIERQYCKAGHERVKDLNRKFIYVEEEGLTYSINCESLAKSNIVKVSKSLKDILSDRFKCFKDPIYSNMKFYDPKYWDDDDETYGEDQIIFLFEHFKILFSKHNLELSKALEEWRSFKICVRENYSTFSVKNLWKMVLTQRLDEFPQLGSLARLLFSISGSNSTVERAFSTLTQILTDRRISLKHKSIEDVMIIKGNDCNWTDEERNEILERAREIYYEKRQRTRLDGQPAIKKRKRNIETSIELSSDDEDEDDTRKTTGAELHVSFSRESESESKSSDDNTSSDHSLSSGSDEEDFHL